MMRGEVAIVGVARTPYSRPKPGERIYTVDEYIALAAELALEQAGMSKNDFDGQGLGVAHAEAGHTVNWSAVVAECLGISPKILLRGDEGGATAAALLIRAARNDSRRHRGSCAGDGSRYTSLSPICRAGTAPFS
jgi:acetyl-CoA acetyltransferase